MSFEITDSVAFFRGQTEYWNKVNESEGFDLEGVIAPERTNGLRAFYCEKSPFRYPYFVDLYAKVGLQRYNMLEGTNLQLDHVIKYNSLMNCLSTYHITLVAFDPTTGSHLPFQVQVDEVKINRLGLKVSIARHKDTASRFTTREPFFTMEPPSLPPFCSTRVPHISTMEPPLFSTSTMEQPLPDPFLSTMEPPFPTMELPPFTLPVVNKKLPEWPSGDAFSDSKRFYLLEESELRDNDWIFVYLQLQVCLFHHLEHPKYLSKLKIVKVAIESTNDERLHTKSAMVYITFKGLAKDGMSEHFERKAIVHRVLDERTGCLSLLGTFPDEEHPSSTMTEFENSEYVKKILADPELRKLPPPPPPLLPNPFENEDGTINYDKFL